MNIDPNAAVIANINSARNEGKKTAVFLGRADSQTLPDQRGWAWFSLNERSYLEKPKYNHIVMDFNDNESLKALSGLFNKAIFDWSTTKFCGKPFQVVHQLLVKEEESEALVEYYPINNTHLDKEYDEESMQFSFNALDDEMSAIGKELDAFEKWKEKVGSEEFERRYQLFKEKWSEEGFANLTPEEIENERLVDFRSEIIEREKLQADRSYAHIDELKTRIDTFLKERFFNQVQYIEGLHPYRAQEEPKMMHYWALKGPLNRV